MGISPFNSIRFRLTLWYAITLAVILAVSAIFSYHYFASNLHRQLDEELYQIAETLADARAQRIDFAEPEQACAQIMGLAHRHNWGAYLLAMDASLQPVCYSHNLLERELPFGPVARQQVRWLKPHIETVHDQRPTGETQELRLLSLPLTDSNRLIGVLQVAKYQGPMHDTVENLRTIYLLVGPFAIFWLCLGCWFLADRLLAPVMEITEAAQKITADKLGQRLPLPGKRDEMAQMATVLNQMLERLENSFRRIRQFSGDASHELRTPLTILRGETEVTLRWAKTPEEFRDMLRSNMEEIDRMERIIESLLTLAKSEIGEVTLEIKPLSLSDLLQELYLQGKILAEPKQITVALELQVSEEVRLRGDELRLRQLFLNLISNGIKYTPEGGSVTIALARQADFAVIDIRDSGFGIAADELPRIFDRFYRVDKARNRMDGGSGLGLAIVKWIVEAHGGQIEVASEPDVGSTFSVKLPLAGPTDQKTPLSTTLD
ncbi:MAG: heavy metal sensor histidine kinase [Desulfuromonadales bacterium]|nr:heavy metal sensor histidine kinase [Desulfuromonadales bacterium]